MSASAPWRSVVRCPFCHDGARPQHLGNSVMLCESCGNRYRIVYATPGKTGRNLARLVLAAHKFASGPVTNKV